MAKWRHRHNLSRLTALFFVALATAAAAAAGETPGAWRDSLTGLAIGGYDPVAYFVAHEPRAGRRSHELQLQDAAWRFENAANRAVFERDPQVYAPQFGGHDPTRIAEGYLAAGNPRLWVVIDDRLYLFVSAQTRTRWLLGGDDLRAAAARNWPVLAEKVR